MLNSHLLADGCDYCAGLGRRVPAVEPDQVQLVSAGILADYRCRACNGCWFSCWNPDVYPPELFGLTVPDPAPPERAA